MVNYQEVSFFCSSFDFFKSNLTCFSQLNFPKKKKNEKINSLMNFLILIINMRKVRMRLFLFPLSLQIGNF
jgi:hypothetical protein